ncbi:hypothetical protein Q8F55_008656 [Vanrija albida]|uniref:Major facilitator superfamily (MFS) profile domain-containing protein n=1 Tax=Vanrija albida TaxID=181172 RepID=A0ABR3PSE5_9TREE
MAATQQHLEDDVEKKVVVAGRSSVEADAVNKVNYYDDARSVSDDGLTSLPKGTFDPVYEAKARVLNAAIQEIGMGWYQWQLFFVVGFGWAADQLWPTAGGLTYPSLVNEFRPKQGPTWQLAGNMGILFGALFWGFSSDIIGRRWGFNITLAITGVFGMVAASSTNWVMVCTFKALWYFGVGGNLPIDSALFIEFLPKSHQYLLTVLSVDWSLASLLANLIAWPILGNHTCPQKATCVRKDNMGWRYFLIAMGGITFLMFTIRFFFFTIFESPKFLMGKGKDEEAVRVVHEVARRNGKTSTLTLADLKACEPEGYVAQNDAAAIAKRRLEVVKFTRVRDLFRGRKLAWSTSLLILIWGFIGLAYPLYNGFVTYLLAQKGANFGKSSPSITYRNSTIIAAMGVPGALIGAFLTEQPRIGRKGALAFAILASGVFLFLTTTAKTLNAYLGFNCGWSVFSTMMYSILYSYTPELFPTSHRGTGNALTASANRLFSIFSPVIAMYANLNTPVPVYVAGALFFAAGLLVIILPFESRGKAAL